MNKDKFCFSITKAKFILTLSIVLLSIFGIVRLIVTNKIGLNSKAATNNSVYLSQEIFNKKVHVVIFNPKVNDPKEPSKTITFDQYLKNNNKAYNEPKALTEQVRDSFKRATGNRISYSIKKTTEISEFPRRSTSRTIAFSDWKYCVDHEYDKVKSERFKTYCHSAQADYNKIINDLKICEAVNKGEIDEVWLWGYSWFGFSESALLGPDGFAFNGLVINDSKCKKLVPIMGFNYQRGLGEALHDFTHRMEATMTTVYKGWSENRKKSKWDLFGLVKAQSSDFSYSGCGSAHYTPTSEGEYEYDTLDKETDTICENFSDYDLFNSPDLFKNPKKTKVNCKNNPWLCTQEGYVEWWFKHIPSFKGTDSDGVLRDWLAYFAEPSLVKKNLSNITYKCKDYDEFGKIFGAKECENKLEGDVACKWFDYCGTCGLSTSKTAAICGGFCDQFNRNIDGCVSAERLGYGCVWHGDKNRCMNSTASVNVVQNMTPLQIQTGGLDVNAKITVKFDSRPALKKTLNVVIYKVLGSTISTFTQTIVSAQLTPDVIYQFKAYDVNKALDTYLVWPKLTFDGNKNPPGYTVTSKKCGPVSQYNKTCLSTTTVEDSYDIQIAKPTCYNFPDKVGCTNAEPLGCAWSGNYNICRKKGDSDDVFPVEYCQSIKDQDTCGLNNEYCHWDKYSCAYGAAPSTPAAITPTPSPLPTKAKADDKYTFTVATKFYDARNDTGGSNGYYSFSITNLGDYRSRSYVNNVKYRIAIWDGSKLISKTDYNEKFDTDPRTHTVKKGYKATIEYFGNILKTDCKTCDIYVSNTNTDPTGKLTPNGSTLSSNLLTVTPGEDLVMKLLLSDKYAMTGNQCNARLYYCAGQGTNTCYHYPYMAKDTDGKSCLYCANGKWMTTTNNYGCMPEKIYP